MRTVAVRVKPGNALPGAVQPDECSVERLQEL